MYPRTHTGKLVHRGGTSLVKYFNLLIIEEDLSEVGKQTRTGPPKYEKLHLYVDDILISTINMLVDKAFECCCLYKEVAIILDQKVFN